MFGADINVSHFDRIVVGGLPDTNAGKGIPGVGV